jgi:hypothetical protein
MQATLEYFPQPRTYQQEVLRAIYESPELLGEGLRSFEYPLYHAEDEELDYFLGSIVRSVTKAAGDVGRIPIVRGVTKTVGGVAKTVGKGVSTVSKVVPMSVLTSTLSWTPAGMAVRAGLGAVQAAAEGRNVFQGAVRSLARDPAMRFAVDTASAAARGENVLKAAQKAAQAGIGDLRQSLQFAAMVAPFIPGIGTGVGAALGAANALAAGQPITDAVIAAARGAIPGGAIAQFAFDTAMNMAKGKNIGEALLNSARSRLPGGPAAQAAFDGALALAKGRNIQDAAFAAAGRLLPPSPYAADALSFVRKVAAGQNIQQAALSTAGNAVFNRIQARTGPILSGVRGRIPQVPSRWPVRELQYDIGYEAAPSPAQQYAQMVQQLRKELAIPFQDPNDPGLYYRLQRLRRLFSGVPPSYAKVLYDRLGVWPTQDDLSKTFHYRLSTATRKELLGILSRIPAPAVTKPPAPVSPPSVWPTSPLPPSENPRFVRALAKLESLVHASNDPRKWRYQCWIDKLKQSDTDDRVIRWGKICPVKTGAIGAAYIVGPCDITMGRPVDQAQIEKTIQTIPDVDTAGRSLGIITYLRSNIVVSEEMTSLPLENLRALHDEVNTAIDKLRKWANSPTGGSSAMPDAYVSIKDWIGTRQRDPKSIYSCM